MVRARQAAELILRAYPQADSRATEAATAELIQLLRTLTSEELGWIMDPRTGIKARCKFLPTPADIMELIRERCAARDAVTASEPRGYQKFEPSPWSEEDERIYRRSGPFEPFPKLYDALKATGELELTAGQTFDVLQGASRELAVNGLDAAKAVLRRTKHQSVLDLEQRLADMKLCSPAKSDATPSLRKHLEDTGYLPKKE